MFRKESSSFWRILPSSLFLLLPHFQANWAMENPVMNIYLFTKEEFDKFLKGYDQYAGFIVSAEQVEAMA